MGCRVEAQAHGAPMHVCGGPYSHWCYPCGRVRMCWGAGAWSANACVRWSVLALVLSMCVCVCPELQSGNAGAWSANACVRWSVLALVLSMQACVRVCREQAHGAPMHVCGGPYSHWCYPCVCACVRSCRVETQAHGAPMHVCGGPYSHWCYPCRRVCVCAC